jgi:hypothetical protein
VKNLNARNDEEHVMFHMNLQISDAHESPFRISMENVDLFKISYWQKLSSIIGDSGTKHLIQYSNAWSR